MCSAIITSSLLLQGVCYVAAADSGYDDHKLYDLSIHRRGFELVVCPVSEIYNHTSSDRLQLIEFYKSELLGQVIIYSWRGISVELLIEHIKGVFKIDRSLTSKRLSESSWTSNPINTTLSNHCLLQLQDTQRTSKSNQIHARKLINQKTNLKNGDSNYALISINLSIYIFSL